MLVFRVENNEGKGCYRDRKTLLILKRHLDSKKHPLPKNDILISREIEKEEICAFYDLHQVCNWFNYKELKNLKELGYTLKLVQVKQITAFGKTQILVKR